MHYRYNIYIIVLLASLNLLLIRHMDSKPPLSMVQLPFLTALITGLIYLRETNCPIKANQGCFLLKPSAGTRPYLVCKSL